jgi:hypothetical protein
MTLKEEFLALLEKDKEFRYAVAGLLGFEEILRRLDKHEEELVKLREDLNRLGGNMLLGFKRHDEELVKLREEMNKLREDMNKLREDMLRGFELMNRHLDALGARWGLMAEEAFREGLKGFLEKELKLSVKRWTEYDGEGTVYGYPSIVEVDMAVSDEKTTLIEISSHIKPSDVLLFLKKAQFYEKAAKRKPDRLIMITPYAEKEAFTVGKRFGVEIYTKV